MIDIAKTEENGRVKNRGKLFIISGPSGVGKDTLIKNIVGSLPDVYLSVSYTTRLPRNNEVPDKDYKFVSDEFFKKEVEQGNMLEYATYCTVCYGTPKKPVEDCINSGKSVILKIERDGMEKVRRIYPDAITIFLMPPSLDELCRRITERKTDSDSAIQKRLLRAAEEIRLSADYMYKIINDDEAKASEELTNIIKSHMGRN